MFMIVRGPDELNKDTLIKRTLVSNQDFLKML